MFLSHRVPWREEERIYAEDLPLLGSWAQARDWLLGSGKGQRPLPAPVGILSSWHGAP